MDRAVNLVRHVTEKGGIDGKLISARGFAGNRPVIDNTAPGDMKANRRVDVIVQSDESDAVKALIPEVSAAQGGESEPEAETVAADGH